MDDLITALRNRMAQILLISEWTREAVLDALQERCSAAELQSYIDRVLPYLESLSAKGLNKANVRALAERLACASRSAARYGGIRLG